MNVKQFRNYRLQVYRPDSDVCHCFVTENMSQLVPGQACSVRELFIRAQQGLPLPPMSNGYSFNGLSLDELSAAQSRTSDRSDVVREMNNLQGELAKSNLQYKRSKKS